jgi:hypothetical protein
MLRSHDEVVRVGMRVAIVIAIVAFLVLLLNGTAYPADANALRSPATVGTVERILLERDALSSQERVAEVRALLDRERRSRLAGLARAVTAAGLRIASSSSPRAWYSGARGIWKQARRWVTLSPTERRALALLEPEIDAGSEDPDLRSLYETLRKRETRALVKRKLKEARRALDRGNLRRARRRIEAARRLDPDFRRLEKLTRRLEELEELQRIPAPEKRFVAASAVTPDELEMSVALLLGRYDSVANLDATTDEARLLQALARYLDGDTDRGLAELRAFSKREGPVADAARAWLEDPSIIDPDRELSRASRRRGLDRALMWIGGASLRARGTDLSLDGIRAWREALAPLNLVLGLPARVLRGDAPSIDAVQKAAARYLELQPEGPRAAESRDWMSRAELSRAMRRRGVAWDDGRLVLPAARTPYASILGRPLLVTREALERAGISALPERAADADALVLATSPHGMAGEGEPLARDVALSLVRELARGLDTGEVQPFGKNRSAAHETVRRMDGGIRSGSARAWVHLWSEPTSETRAALRILLADGDEQQLGNVEVERGRKRVRASRTLFGREVSCPRRAVCLDRDRALSSTASAEVESGGGVRLATRAAFHDMVVAVKVEELVPSATVSIPIARWLRIERWLPFGARLGIGLGGISLGPTVREVETPLYAADEGLPDEF